MKTIFTAAALSVLAATGAFAANAPSGDAAALRTIELTNGQDIRDNGGASASATVGTPVELPVTVLPPRDRVEAGYKANTGLSGSAFSGAAETVKTPR